MGPGWPFVTEDKAEAADETTLGGIEQAGVELRDPETAGGGGSSDTEACMCAVLVGVVGWSLDEVGVEKGKGKDGCELEINGSSKGLHAGVDFRDGKRA